MAKTLLLLRHAKAAWPDDVTDHDRPLTGRGRRDAAAVGAWLTTADLAPDTAYVSSAARTRETFNLLAAELAAAPTPEIRDDAYAAGAGDLLDLVRSTPETSARVLVVAHNPGIATLAGLLDDEATDVPDRSRMRLDYRTSGCSVFDIPDRWADLNPGRARLLGFTTPGV